MATMSPFAVSIVLSIVTLFHGSSTAESAEKRPNIIFMFGDDLGFNELGFSHCTDTKTPFMDNLATTEGLILRNNYVSKICSPSRSAFMSGRYPSTLGLQNLVFNVQYPVSLTRQVSILSEEFKAAGYKTHIVGKWHLGYTSWEYTPTYRGFDTFHGFYGGTQHYYDHKECMDIDCYYDLRIDEDRDTVNVEAQQYGTFLERDQALEVLSDAKDSEDPFFLYIAWQSSHTPNEAPSMYRQLYPNAKNEDRNYCQAQTTALDGSVGEVVSYLKSNEMWDNTLVVFSSDNGGEYNRHDNFPLRGFKNTSFEGGVRVPAFVTGGFLNEERWGQIERDLVVSVVDWYPTLLSAAGIEVGYQRSRTLYGSDELDTRFDAMSPGTVPLDGKDVWSAIQYGTVPDELSSKSREVLLDLDRTETCLFSSCGAIRSGRWKFIRGANMGVNESVTNGSQWLDDFATCTVDSLGCSQSEVTASSLYCHLLETGCLFNLDLDGCEKNDVGEQYPEIRSTLIKRLDFYESQAAPYLIVAGAGMDIEEFDPSEWGDSYWGPYREYDDVDFEDTLLLHFNELFPGTESEALHKEETAPSVGDAFPLSKVLLAVLSIALVLMLYIVGRYCLSPKQKLSAHHEEAPLLAQKDGAAAH